MEYGGMIIIDQSHPVLVTGGEHLRRVFKYFRSVHKTINLMN
jgi:hypothetical protein